MAVLPHELVVNTHVLGFQSVELIEIASASISPSNAGRLGPRRALRARRRDGRATRDGCDARPAYEAMQNVGAPAFIAAATQEAIINSSGQCPTVAAIAGHTKRRTGLLFLYMA